MILVVDTNLLLSHAELDGQSWGEVVQAVADDVLTVVIPHVVADELTARVRANRRATKPIRPEGKGFHRAPPSVSDAVEAAYSEANKQIQQWAQSYDAHRILADAGFTIRPAPLAGHEDLGWRAAYRRRPFDDAGNGYRDTLHWFTVLELLRENPGEHVVLLSGDNKAFWEGNNPHPHIVAEYEPLLVDGTTFTLARKLSDISIPSKYTKDEEPVALTNDERDEIVRELFANGALRAPDLDPDQPDGVEITDPRRPTVIFARARELTTGGSAYQVRIRLNAQITLDWVDWIDDPADDSLRGDFDITVWYVRDTAGLNLDRTDVQRTPPEPSPRRASNWGQYPSRVAWEFLKGARVSDINTSALARDYIADALRNIGHLPIAELMRSSFITEAAHQAALGFGTPGTLAEAAAAAASAHQKIDYQSTAAQQAMHTLNTPIALAAAAAAEQAIDRSHTPLSANLAERTAQQDDLREAESQSAEAVRDAPSPDAMPAPGDADERN